MRSFSVRTRFYVLSFSGELLVCEPFADNARYGQPKAVAIGHAVVIAESLFAKVTKKMKRFHAHVGSVNAALQEAPKVFESVGMDLPVNVSNRMVDDLMRVVALQSVIGKQFISVGRGACFDALFDFGVKSLFAAIINHKGLSFSATLQESDDGSLAFSTSSSDTAPAFTDVHVPRFATNEGLINLNLSGHLSGQAVLQSKPDAVHHEPCGLLGDSKIAGDFIGANSVLAVDHHPDNGKPLVEADRGVLEDGSYFDRELAVMVNALALPLPLISEEAGVSATASRADHLAVPPSRNQVGKAVVGVSEVKNCFLQGLWFVAHNVPQKQKSTKDHLICQVYS